MSEFKNELHQQIIFYQNQPSFLDVILGKKKAAIQEKKIVIFGAGVLGKQAALAFKHTGVIIDRFIDNNSEKWNLEYKGIKCQSPESLSEDARDCFVLISPATDTSKIVAQLKNIGLTEDQILWNQEQRVKFGNSYYYYLANCLNSMLSSIQNPFEIINRDIEEISRIHKHLADEKSKKIFLSKLALTCAGENFGALNNYLENHSDTIIENRMKFGNDATNHFPNPEFEYYFRQDFLAFSDDEIYVDVGAADGDTIKPFLTEMLCRKKTIKKIYAFEPDPFSFQELEKNLKAFSFIEPHRIGVTQETGTTRFSPMTERDLKLCGTLSESGEVEIPCISIDDFFSTREAPTLIKLDPGGDIIPGIIKGAEETIIKSRPKIIAGAYHSVESIYRVPEILLRKNYKVYLRHLAYHANETHAFAI